MHPLFQRVYGLLPTTLHITQHNSLYYRLYQTILDETTDDVFRQKKNEKSEHEYNSGYKMLNPLNLIKKRNR